MIRCHVKNTLSINPNRIDLDEAYMEMAETWARRSKANRSQVGAIIVRDRQIISDGYNGMPTGSSNEVCEYYDGDILKTYPEVLHAESNALMKISRNGGNGASGASLYVTLSPCPECAKLIIQAQIKRVVYRTDYRLTEGIDLLRSYKIQVDQLA
jgi:dCMP deaminase